MGNHLRPSAGMRNNQFQRSPVKAEADIFSVDIQADMMSAAGLQQAISGRYIPDTPPPLDFSKQNDETEQSKPTQDE